jgi:hypothetical protein
MLPWKYVILCDLHHVRGVRLIELWCGGNSKHFTLYGRVCRKSDKHDLSDVRDRAQASHHWERRVAEGIIRLVKEYVSVLFALSHSFSVLLWKYVVLCGVSRVRKSVKNIECGIQR